MGKKSSWTIGCRYEIKYLHNSLRKNRGPVANTGDGRLKFVLALNDVWCWLKQVATSQGWMNSVAWCRPITELDLMTLWCSKDGRIFQKMSRVGRQFQKIQKMSRVGRLFQKMSTRVGWIIEKMCTLAEFNLCNIYIRKANIRNIKQIREIWRKYVKARGLWVAHI